ncbi:hypothetical protein JCGZ_24850 [Jatropha curcas]|uniref:Uncharacterized protein n=1 Tax=Jatropha curcas TaxID=180498 RepID=A0A067KXC3_JATCU|nr:uncharacterized protein LOC105631532 isoform X2 [Jatropha curcas]KDP40851.1 hypothetical protein JCGZ_24850 [Jatropha curcas]
MDGSDKSVSSSSTPDKPHSVTKVYIGNTDENEQSHQEMGLTVQNLNRSTSTKHFMSPTVSAASKFNPPRKKILAERNESLDNSLQKTPNLDSKPLQKASSLGSKTSSSTDFDEKEKNALVYDLSPRPYDPVTNYLSPRPKFLRYNPNRRQAILLKRENQAKQGKDRLTISDNGSVEIEKGIDEIEVDLASSCGSLAFCSKEADLNKEFEEIDESDDEFDEERSWNLKGVLKVLILLAILVISTSYISSMNSPTPSPVVQAVVGLKDGYRKIQDHVYEFVKNGKCKMGFVDIDGIKKDEMIEDVNIGGGGGEVDDEAEYRNELNEMVDIKSEESKVLEMVENELNEGGKSEDLVIQGGEIADQSELNEIVDVKVEESKVLQVVENQLNGGGENEDLEMQGEVADCIDLEMGISDEIAANSELQALESVGVVEIPLTIVSNDEYEIKEEIFNREMVEIGNITEDKNEHEIAIDEAEEGTEKEGIIKHMETESIIKAVFGFSLFSSIFASLVLGLHFRKNRIARKGAYPVADSYIDSKIPEKCSSVIANKEVKQTVDPVSFANSNSSMNSLEEEEDSKQTYESRAPPSIELLGELVVEEMSISLRNCGIKSRIIESEVSSHSVSMEKGISSKANSVPVRLQPAFSDISNMYFPSYSDKRKIAKKQDEEVNNVMVATPLRRSSRIRNRTIASP